MFCWTDFSQQSPLSDFLEQNSVKKRSVGTFLSKFGQQSPLYYFFKPNLTNSALYETFSNYIWSTKPSMKLFWTHFELNLGNSDLYETFTPNSVVRALCGTISY